MNLTVMVTAADPLAVFNRIVSLLRGRRFSVAGLAYDTSGAPGAARITVTLDEARSRAERAAACIERLEHVVRVSIEEVAAARSG